MNALQPNRVVKLPADLVSAIEAANTVCEAEPELLFAPQRERASQRGVKPNRARWAGVVAIARRDGICALEAAVMTGVAFNANAARDSLRRVHDNDFRTGVPTILDADEPAVAAALDAIGAAGAAPLTLDPIALQKVREFDGEERVEIRTRLLAGESAEAVAESLRRPVKSIQQFARDWGIGRPPSPPRQIARTDVRMPLMPPRSTGRTFGRPATRWTETREVRP